MPVSDAHINRLRGFNFNALGTDHCSDEVCEAIEAVCTAYLAEHAANATDGKLTVREVQLTTALARIRYARDYKADHGHYPGTEAIQHFDDWAADVADQALKGLPEVTQPETSNTADLDEAEQEQLRDIARRSRGLVVGPWAVAGAAQLDGKTVLPIVHGSSGLAVAYVPYSGLATQRNTADFIATAAADAYALCNIIGRLRQSLRNANLNIAKRQKSEHEAMQLLGDAMGCPRYGDSPDIFPQATENDGVCTGPHSLETLAKSAADRIRDTDNAIKYLERTASQRAVPPSYLQPLLRAGCQCHQSGYMLNTGGSCPQCGTAAKHPHPVDQLVLLSDLSNLHRENDLLKAWKAEATKLIDQLEKAATVDATKLPPLVTIFTKIQRRLPSVVPWFTENIAGATLQLYAHADADVRLVLFHRNVDGKVRIELLQQGGNVPLLTLLPEAAASDDTAYVLVSHLKQDLPQPVKSKSDDTQYAVAYASTGGDKVAYLHVCSVAGQSHVELCNDIQQSTRCLSREAAEELLKAWKHIKWPRRTDGDVVPYYPH